MMTEEVEREEKFEAEAAPGPAMECPLQRDVALWVEGVLQDSFAVLGSHLTTRIEAVERTVAATCSAAQQEATTPRIATAEAAEMSTESDTQIDLDMDEALQKVREQTELEAVVEYQEVAKPMQDGDRKQKLEATRAQVRKVVSEAPKFGCDGVACIGPWLPAFGPCTWCRVAEETDEENAGQDILYVSKKSLEDLQANLKKRTDISKDAVDALTHLEKLAAEEIVVPVDMRGVGQEFEDVEEMLSKLGPKGTAEAFVKAKSYFDANKDGDSESERPQPMTAAEWMVGPAMDDADSESDVSEEHG